MLIFAQKEKLFLHIKGGPIWLILVNSEPPECVLQNDYHFGSKLHNQILTPKVVVTQISKQCELEMSFGKKSLIGGFIRY